MDTIASYLPTILKSVVGDEEACLIFLQELWGQIVGEDLAKNTKPTSFGSGRLELRVPNQVWMRQLEELSPLIAKAVNRYWGCRLVERILVDCETD
jgi:hypothetical protein